MFTCDKCGRCCRNLNRSDLYSELHNGDGVCKYLKGNLCSIYIVRPLLCRVDECYDIFFKDRMSYDEYCYLNKLACEKLKNKEEDKNVP